MENAESEQENIQNLNEAESTSISKICNLIGVSREEITLPDKKLSWLLSNFSIDDIELLLKSRLVNSRIMEGYSSRSIPDLVTSGQWDFLWAFWEMRQFSQDPAIQDVELYENQGEMTLCQIQGADAETRKKILLYTYENDIFMHIPRISTEEALDRTEGWVEEKRAAIENAYKISSTLPLFEFCFPYIPRECKELLKSLFQEPPSFFPKETWLLDVKEYSEPESIEMRESSQLCSPPQQEALPIGVTLDHLMRELIVDEKRSPAGQCYLLFKALWNAPCRKLSHENLALAVYGENETLWPQDWSKDLGRLKCRVKSFLNDSKEGLGDSLLPSREKKRNAPHCMGLDRND